MMIYFKCSFKSSNGFKIGKYNPQDDSLVYVRESKEELKEAGIPDAVEFTLKNQIRGTLLATDENGQFFFGVYRLIEEDDDKFVSAVFCSENQETAFQLYQLFCKNYAQKNIQLLDCVNRKKIDMLDKDALEFQIDAKKLSGLLQEAKQERIHLPEITVIPDAILAFITENTLADYRLTLGTGFYTEKIFLCEHITPEQPSVVGYEQAYAEWQKNEMIPVLIPALLYGIPTLVSLAYYFGILS